ncbi:jacalin-related lectin 3-like isoform X2 [Benincasa hispida]|uniref:jacalin-related lectin 3-like isoform X2 n=1 Tax=Benincasa hispida TaxID=102211 RepID=UPI001900F922|nr:jacalin-related lectin 3-like isoform X2 [Benincasa hispida]
MTTLKIEIVGCKDGGGPWDDGAHSTIRQLVIYHKQWICSFHVEYDKNGHSIWGSKHGGNEGSSSKVVLDYPNEYLISIYGYYGYIGEWGIAADVIRSITFQTNRKTYGPYGMEEGAKFSFPIMGAKIVGFHGRCGWFLDAIGLYIQPIPKTQLKNFSLGPYGGKGGHPWEYTFRSIRRFVIHHEQWIHSIQLEYEDKNGKLVWSKKHGDTNGSSKSEVVLQFPDEYFVSIHGYYSHIQVLENTATVIRSLTLETNTRTYGPFGVEDGTKFLFPIMETDIVGVYGRSSVWLDAIGLYLGTTQNMKVEPEPMAAPAPQIQMEHSKLRQYGGEGGDAWEDKFQTMRRFVVRHGLWIDSIQIQYEDDNGNLVWSNQHGGDGGSRSEVVLEFPDEYLVSIHGYYSDIRTWGHAITVIRSLTLETNKKTYGPFGVEDGSKFSFPIVGFKVVGIHGRSGWYLDAFGLYVLSIQM